MMTLVIALLCVVSCGQHWCFAIDRRTYDDARYWAVCAWRYQSAGACVDIDRRTLAVSEAYQ